MSVPLSLQRPNVIYLGDIKLLPIKFVWNSSFEK